MGDIGDFALRVTTEYAECGPCMRLLGLTCMPGEGANDGLIWGDDKEIYFPLFCLTEVPFGVGRAGLPHSYILYVVYLR